MRLFGRHASTMLSIDLSDDTVKILELSRKKNQLVVENYAIIPQADKNTAEIIKDTLKQAKIKTNHAVTALPNSAVLTKIVQMDASLSEDDLEAQLLLESEQFMSQPLEDLSIDFDVLGPSVDNSQTNDVYLAIARRENVTALVNTLEAADLDVVAVDVEACALERLTTTLGFSCSTANPFRAFTLSPDIDIETLLQNAPIMKISCGLALRSFAWH